jgi:two-component system response regulator TtrR
LELQEHLKRRGVDIPIIFVSGHGDIPMTVRAMRGGALDFLTKPYSDQDLLDRVQSALHLDRQRQQARREEATVLARYDLLTQREQEVLSLIVQGSTNKQVAINLDISVKTVETHRARVMDKMRVESLAELCAVHQTVIAVRRSSS